MENTVFSHSMLAKISEHYQAHLERISDYLLVGPGVWWKEMSGGIMFLDGSSEQDYREAGPTLQHFKSFSCSDNGDLQSISYTQHESDSRDGGDKLCKATPIDKSNVTSLSPVCPRELPVNGMAGVCTGFLPGSLMLVP